MSWLIRKGVYFSLGNGIKFEITRALDFLFYLAFTVSMFLLQDSHDQTTYMIYYGLGAIVFLRSIFKFQRLRKIDSTILVYFAFVFYATAGLFWGPSIQMPAFKLFLFGAAMFVAFYIELSTFEACEQFILVLYVASIMLSIYFLVNMTVADAAPGRTKVEGLNVINAGIVSSIGALSSVYLSIRKKRKIYYLAMIVYYYVVLMSGSKLAIFASVSMPILFCYFINKRPSKRLKLVLIAILGIAIAYVIIMNNDKLYNSIGYRIEGLYRMVFYGEEGDDTLRLIMIVKGVDLFKQNPILGVGFDCYRVLNGWTDTWSHCNYIEVLSCLGLVGIVLYYLRFFMCYCSINKRNKNKTGSDITGSYAKALIITIVIMEIGIVTMHAAIYQVLFALAYRLGTTVVNGEMTE